MKKIGLMTLVLISAATMNELKAQDMGGEKLEKIEITDSMESVNPDWFTGRGWLETKMSDTGTFGVSISNVIFEPGCRNHWHKHPGGQLLIVTEGVGYYQERGKQVKVIRKGDVVAIYPDIEHWHGATPESWFAHMAMGTNPDAGPTEWMEPVSDEHYYSLDK